MDLSQPRWRTSTYTQPNNPNCVEVGPTRTAVSVRDTKTREAGALAVAPATFAAFVNAVTADQFAR